MAKRNKKRTFEGEDSGFKSSLAGAFAGLQIKQPTPTPSTTSTTDETQAEAETPAEFDPSLCEKIILRTERKGRGGKTVTIIRGLNQEDEVLQVLCKQLRRELGCGSGVEADRIVLHGDQMLRVQGWLKKKGLTHIVLGNRPGSS